MTKIRIMRAWEKQEEKRVERLELLRQEAPFKAWVLPVLSRLDLDFDGYRYTGNNSVRIHTMLEGEPRWIDITWEKL